jgi:hypothetical protein
MDDGAAGKTLIVPASWSHSPRAPKPAVAGFCLVILAANVKIQRGFEALADLEFSFRYNGVMHRQLCMSHGDASPSKMGPQFAIQVWAVALSTAIKHRYVRCTRLAQPGAARLQRT